MSRVSLAWTVCMLVACGGAQTTSGVEPETDEPVGSTEAVETTEQDETPSEDAPAATGRMAFTQCDSEHRPEMCTKEYRPVCAEIDNGVRCITTPCDSTDQRNFGNACMACADPAVTGHWPVACEALGNDAH